MTNEVEPKTLAEKWLSARLGEAGGFRVEAIIAHGKRDGHSEPTLRAAFKNLGFVQFAEPGTGQPVWSSFLRCMAPDAHGTIVWADSAPRTTTQSTRPVAAPLAQRISRPSTQTPAGALPPPYDNATLADRRLGIEMSDEAQGRAALAAELVTAPWLSVAEARAILRAAPRDRSRVAIDIAEIYKSRANTGARATNR